MNVYFSPLEDNRFLQIVRAMFDTNSTKLVNVVHETDMVEGHKEHLFFNQNNERMVKIVDRRTHFIIKYGQAGRWKMTSKQKNDNSTTERALMQQFGKTSELIGEVLLGGLPGFMFTR